MHGEFKSRRALRRARKHGVAQQRQRPTIVVAEVLAVMMAMAGMAHAGQLPLGVFQTYNAALASSIVAGPFALYAVPVDSLHPTQLNLGFAEVDKKAAGFNIETPAQLTTDLLTDIEPVVIGPGGVLYQTDGHHTFAALIDSTYGASNPTVYVNVIANFSNLTESQFVAAIEADNLVYPVNDGVLETIDPSTGAPLPASLTGMTADVYRGLEYSILKNKSSKLFTSTSNITGAVGVAIPGIDKSTGFYADFINADAYRGANNGLGLPYLSPADIAIASAWNLNGANTTTLPSVTGAVKVAQLPGYILPTGGSIVINGVVGDATLANGALDGTFTGTFNAATQTGVGAAGQTASFNGVTHLSLGSVTVGTTAPGFILQLGNDDKATVTLNGVNTYTGGTTIAEGALIVNGDAALGAAPTAFTYQANNIIGSVQAANGIVFNSLTEGNGSLTFSGTTPITEARAIAVDGEIATIDPGTTTVTLTGQIVSTGALSAGIGNADGESDLSIGLTGIGTVILAPTGGSNANFYGNLILTSGTLVVSSDAAMGNLVGPPVEIGQIDLNGGTFKAGASFSSVRSLFMASGSTYDTNGFATSFAGNFQDVQRTIAITNSSTSSAGSVAFGTFEAAGGTATVNVNGGTQGTTVTFTNGIIRDPGATLILQPTNAPLGTTAGEQILNPNAAATLTNGIAAPWMVVYNATPTNKLPLNPYSFATYGANGYAASTGNSTNITTSTASSVVLQSGNATLAANAAAYALSVQAQSLTAGTTINLGGNTLTLGNGTTPAGLILNGVGSTSASGQGSAITNGTLAFGGSEGVIWMAGTPTNPNTISAQITGSGGLTFAGGLQATDLSLSGSQATNSGAVTIGTATTETGQITIDSGVVTLGAADVFKTSTTGIYLADTKKSPSPAILDITANNTVSALDSAGTNSTVNISNGAALTIGDTTLNLSSTLLSTITETGAATAGVITKNGSGLLDLSNGNGITLVAGSTVLVNDGILRIGNGLFSASATNGIVVATGAQLQYSGNGGSVLNDPISGGGSFNVVAGTVKLTGTNTYSGGTLVQLGGVLDASTATLPNLSSSTITANGGTVVFDQNINGTYAGVISDGPGTGGCTLSGSSTYCGTLIKDDSSNVAIAANGTNSNLTLAQAQTYTGGTIVEAGTLTLGATDTIKTSLGVDLGRVGGAISTGTTPMVQTATLSLGGNNTIQALTDELSNATFVQLNGNTLTIDPVSGASWGFAGTFADTGAGGLTLDGPGAETLLGTGSVIGGALTVSDGFLFEGGGFTSASASITSGDLIVSGTMITTGTTTVSGGLLLVGSALDSGAETLTGVAIPAATLTDTTVSGGLTVAALTETSGMVDIVTTLTSNGAITASGGTFLVGGTANTAMATFSGATAQITGALTATGAVAVTGGSVLDDGTITAASATLSAGAMMVGDGGHTGAAFNSSLAVSGTGMLMGYGTITGAVSNASVVAPGGMGNELLSLNANLAIVQSSNGAPARTTGKLSIVGSYTQTSHGTLAIELNGTVGSVLAVTGTASLSGTLSIMEDPAFYSRGTFYPVVTATGGLGGSTFLNVVNPEPYLLFQTVYTPTAADLSLTNFALPNSFGGVTLAPIVNALDDAPYGSAIDGITNAIGNLPGSPQLQAQLLAELVNYGATAVQQAAGQTLQSIQGTLAGWGTIDAGTQPGPQSAALNADEGASAPLGPYTMRMQGFAQFGTLNGNANAPGVDSTIAGGVIGLDAPVDMATRVGAAFSYANSGVSVQGPPQSGTLDAYAVSLYAGHHMRNLVFDGALTFAYDTATTTRTIGVTNTAAKGNGDGYGVAASGGVSYPIEVFDKTMLEPRLGLEYDYNHQNGFTETDAGTADLQVLHSDFNNFRTTAGAKLSRVFTFEDGTAMTPVFRAAWAHEWADAAPTIGARFAATPSASFSTTGANPGRDAALLGIGIDYSPSPSITLFARYDAALSSAETDQSVRAGFKVSW